MRQGHAKGRNEPQSTARKRSVSDHTAPAGLDASGLCRHNLARKRSRGHPITQRDHPDGAAAGVALLFRKGTRPDAVAVRALADNGGFGVSHDPSRTDGAGNWLELLVNGLAFDLVGLAGGPAAAMPAVRHRFGIEDAQLGELETVALAAGPHLSGGEALLPIVRSQLALALQLAQLPGLAAVGWVPAQTRMAVDYFGTVASAWLEGRAFPALGLTALVPALDGGLHSEGLAFFTGQELRIEPELVEDREQATRLAVRLINQLAAQDAVDRRFEFTGPDGAALSLEPSANGRFVRVRAG